MSPLGPLTILLCAGAVLALPNRIVGGQDTTIEEYPSIVQIEAWREQLGTWSHSCAANILTSFYLLSAAHCFEGEAYRPDFRRIRAGTTLRGSGGVVHYVEYALNHPEYRVVSRYDADINIVKLITPLAYTASVSRGTIVAQGTVIPDNLPVVHAGWGTTEWQGQLAPILQDVTIYTINNELCAQRYVELNPTSIVTKNMICAGIFNVGGKDACQGDSGGPLYYGDIIIGVVSWGHRCANETYPGISTAVASYTDWVVENAR